MLREINIGAGLILRSFSFSSCFNKVSLTINDEEILKLREGNYGTKFSTSPGYLHILLE